MILIYTVGVGTPGKTSDVAQGLANSIGKMSEVPRRVWLVPSQDETSVANAELIQGEHAEVAEVMDSGCRFSHVDDFLSCREVMRKVIRRAKEDLEFGERLIVNPTGGTKQMGIGAFLAAADEGVGEITFVGGLRNEGTVITGQEENLFFDARMLHRERAWRHAESLFSKGACESAATILEPFADGESRDTQKTNEMQEVARCLGHWQSLDYRRAAELAARLGGTMSSEVRTHLQTLRNGPEVSSLKAGDMLASAFRLSEWRRFTDAMLRFCQTLEIAAASRLEEGYGEVDARKEGLRAMMEQLHRFDDECGELWRSNKKLSELVTTRNHFIHNGSPVSAERVIRYAAEVKPFVKKLLPDIRVEQIERLWPAKLMDK
jgi:hypothetical protein